MSEGYVDGKIRRVQDSDIVPGNTLRYAFEGKSSPFDDVIIIRVHEMDKRGNVKVDLGRPYARLYGEKVETCLEEYSVERDKVVHSDRWWTILKASEEPYSMAY